MSTLRQFFGDAVASGQSTYVTDPRILPYAVYSNGYLKTWSNYNDAAHETHFWYRTIPRYFHMFNDEWSTVYTDAAWENPNFKDDNATNHSGIDNYEATNNSEIHGGYLRADYATQTNQWLDVCNHSGYGGYLTWVIGLGNHGQPVGSKSYIRITVDGVSYEFVGNLHYRNGSATSSHERLFWGSLMSTSTTANPYAGGMLGNSHSHLGDGSHHRSYYHTMNPQGTKTYPEEGIGLPMPHEAIPSKGFSSLRFENSIRVEVKIEAPTGGTYAPGGPGSPSYMCNYAAAAIRKDPTFPGF